MGRSRYKIYEPTHPHFVTCTILHWLPLFTRQESVAIIIDSIKFLQNKDNLKLYAYVILENHLHMLLSSDDLHKSMQSFKQYTAKQLLPRSTSPEVERVRVIVLKITQKKKEKMPFVWSY